MLKDPSGDHSFILFFTEPHASTISKIKTRRTAPVMLCPFFTNMIDNCMNYKTERFCCRCLNSLSASLPGAPLSFFLGQPSVVLGLLFSISSREQFTRELDKYLLAKNLFRCLASNLNYWEGLLGMIIFPSSWSLPTTHLGRAERKSEQRSAPENTVRWRGSRSYCQASKSLSRDQLTPNNPWICLLRAKLSPWPAGLLHDSWKSICIFHKILQGTSRTFITCS